MPNPGEAALAGRRIEAVVIGASAGGVEALGALLPALPAGYGLPVFCILHLPADRESRWPSCSPGACRCR
jgi:two-component system chemotaxis response regulator CheB